MKEATKAAFSFEKYKITKFNFVESEVDHSSLGVKFAPSGEYNQDQGEFLMRFEFIAHTDDQEEREFVNVTMEADFKFNEPIPFQDLPDYFYRNSIAIVFPYLRAFVSTLTSLANIKPVILPILNLTMLEEAYRANTVVK